MICLVKKLPRLSYLLDPSMKFFLTFPDVMPGFLNQSRICGKGVGLGLFPSESLQSQPYEFDEIAHIGPCYGVE